MSSFHSKMANKIFFLLLFIQKTIKKRATISLFYLEFSLFYLWVSSVVSLKRIIQCRSSPGNPFVQLWSIFFFFSSYFVVFLLLFLGRFSPSMEKHKQFNSWFVLCDKTKDICWRTLLHHIYITRMLLEECPFVMNIRLLLGQLQMNCWLIVFVPFLIEFENMRLKTKDQGPRTKDNGYDDQGLIGGIFCLFCCNWKAIQASS